ncbi:MAG TPA: 2-C-methyl-D-erythritol 4-phosphate cytidylyltransferase [Thermomicrobiales bacterium]|jgi:2-C-methyl-D-erythritol 4-phosphate cytidylyltransferase|nr:2-C-methyl-D-erythritol 4-phosphate cytidylyltransferase [Thermomicrobiales bacterium]
MMTPSHRADAVIVAAGRGTRYGAVDKVLLPLLGRPLLAWSLDAFANAGVGQIVVVAGDHTLSPIATILDAAGLGNRCRVVAGGARRQDSVAAGVAALHASSGPVVIHDGARPLLSPDLIVQAIAAVPANGAAVVAAPVADTLKRVDADLQVVETVSRAGLWAAQTPQVFDRAALQLAIDDPSFAVREYTDEAGLFEELGLPVTIVPSTRPNPKLTHPGDLLMIEALAGLVLHEEEA